MADSKQIQQIVERAVAQVLDQQLPRLQAALVERVLAELPAQPDAAPADGQASSGNLARAVSSIHAGTTQKEILKALLDAGSSCASRVALFVVKAGAASGWQSRGFGNDETVKDFSLDMSAGPIAHAYQNRVVAPANIAEMDGRFVKQFGGPENEQILVLPLVLKEKVAALLYADGGSEGVLDAASLEVIVMATSSWLEVVSLRKAAQKDTMEPAPSMEARARLHQRPLLRCRVPVHSLTRLRRTLRSIPLRHLRPSLPKLSRSSMLPRRAQRHPLRPQPQIPSPASRPRTPTRTARRNASPDCWSMRSSSTTRQKLQKGAATKICTTG